MDRQSGRETPHHGDAPKNQLHVSTTRARHALIMMWFVPDVDGQSHFKLPVGLGTGTLSKQRDVHRLVANMRRCKQPGVLIIHN